jgi:hypothetical protein
MRENMGKFRGRRLDNGEWVHGFYTMTGVTGKNGGFKPSIVEFDGGSTIPRIVDPATVGECSGVPDEHGEMVYEGDILFDGVTQYVVEYGATTCGLQAFGRGIVNEIWSLYHLCTEHNYRRKVERIGTIHDAKGENHD